MDSIFISEGDKINHTPSGDVDAGDVIVMTDLIGVADRAIKGIRSFPKAVLSTSALAQGKRVYWDAGAQEVTTTAGSNKQLGYVAEAALAADTTVAVLISRD